MFFLYWMDRHEPESMKSVITAMAVGALSTIPALIIQLLFETAAPFQQGGFTGAFNESFLLVAPSEELFKFLFIYFYVRSKPFFDEVNDGIVYFGAGALGFALLENIFYVLDYGFATGIMRALTSIPIHLFCGVIVGYHVGLARFTGRASPNRIIIRGLFLAYLTHALFNTLVSLEGVLALLFIPFVASVYYFGYRILHRGRKISLAGSSAEKISTAPGLPEIPPTTAAVRAVSAQPAAVQADVGKVQQVPLGLPSASIGPGPERKTKGPVKYHSEEVMIDSEGRKYLPPKKEKWKAALSRILLGATALLWILAFVGEDSPTEIWDLVLGMVILTIIPFMVGLLLELSYRRRKDRPVYFE